MPRSKPKYRLFLSYVRKDHAIASTIVTSLATDFTPLWDMNIRPGREFAPEIRDMIGKSHVFVALITPEAYGHPWVHQEAGYAMALNIPILAITVGDVEAPHAMLEQFQAIRLSPDGSDVGAKLQQAGIVELIEQKARASTKFVEIIEYTGQRSEVLARHADDLWMRDMPSVVRQRGPISTFSLPTERITAKIWDRFGGDIASSQEFRKALYKERMALDRHARNAGCRLLINPELIEKTDPRALPVRIEMLISFLEGMPDEKVLIAVVDTGFSGGSFLALGDWVMALSHAPIKVGYRQTLFVSHAPTVLHEVTQFDEEVQATLARQKVKPRHSRRLAIQRLGEILERKRANALI